MAAPPVPPPVPPSLDLDELERLAVAVATEAGQLVVNRPSDLSVSATKSSGTDIVTVMDQAAQDLIRTRLSAARPADAFLGEERGGSVGGDSGITWVVDPIDGTVNYLYDIPAYAVSVAAVLGDPTRPGAWRPVAGAVVGPATGEVFRARIGGGAHRRRFGGQEVALSGSACTDLTHALIGTGFGYQEDTRRWQARILVEVLPQIRDIRRIGSAALDLCHVGDGSLDGYYESGLNPWDMAAGWLVVAEAGGSAVVSADAGFMWASAPGIAGELGSVLDAALRATAAR